MNLTIQLKNIRRATVFVALFFVSSGLAATETYRDIIQKAYNLSLQKDRPQAISILVGAIKKEGRKSTAQKELSSALEQVSKVFYSDKAQQVYELAISLRGTDPNTALSKLQEASRLEPENALIEMELVRQAIAAGDCHGASARLAKQKELVSVIEEFQLLNAQTSVCLGRFQEYLALKASHDPKQSAYVPFWQTVESEYYFRTGVFLKALEAALAAQKTDLSFPEPLYWQWKAEVEMKHKISNAASKYLNLCKTLNSRLHRKYMPEPQLCRRIPEIEIFLKKNNNSEV